MIVINAYFSPVVENTICIVVSVAFSCALVE
ncbi:hypothetical protein JCM5805K_0348 [Lactococcus lactis subsp. lactis]|uniref:Uncharacterized protein n=1 Tax=Lactococcus lactis subsp. lactis TaxID=1360 RepID=A0A0B8QL25_LACLL|nr:hypothetical protein JCM5805K_0348 [Lactococcus lactis subsp. lactis]